MKPQLVLRNVLSGLGAGVLISLAPLPINLVVAVGLLVLWAVRGGRRPPGERGVTVITVCVALTALTAAVELPIKALDRQVPPLRYPPMPLGDLCQRLRKDHRVLVRGTWQLESREMAAFETVETLSRRAVLACLARAADCELRIRHCDVGATLLFGGLPMARLVPKAPAGELPSREVPRRR